MISSKKKKKKAIIYPYKSEVFETKVYLFKEILLLINNNEAKIFYK